MVGGGYLLQDNKRRENNMGFDLYGLSPLNPNNAIKPEHFDWTKKHTDEEKDQFFKAMNQYEQEVKGHYFRANVWWWRPLWEYVCMNCDDILTLDDVEHGEFNNGHKISKTKAKKIAARLRRLDRQGKIMEYELEHKQFIKFLPKEECDICDGTGKRKEAPKTGAGDIKCNGCQGSGEKDNWNCHYPFESQIVVEFAEFCEESGGFEIC